MFKVSQSKIKCWLRCRREYWYKYVKSLTKRNPPSPLLRGRIVHTMIEEFINGRDPWIPFAAYKKHYDKLFREEQEEYGDLPGLIEGIMNEYFRWHKKDPIKYLSPKGSKQKAEFHFEVPLTKTIMISGVIDAVGRTRDKSVWLTDHKMHNKLPEELNYTDIQTVIYQAVLEQIGFPKADGMLWNYLRAKAPSIPDVLKSGELSRRKNIDTTWTIYRQAIKDAGLIVRDYDDMKELLEGNENNFFVRVYLPLNKVLMKNLMGEVIFAAEEIKGVNEEEEENFPRSMGKHCDWCQMKDLCQADLFGEDTSLIIKRRFRSRDDEKKAEEKIYQRPRLQKPRRENPRRKPSGGKTKGSTIRKGRHR